MAEDDRAGDAQELRFMRALRLAIPASLDDSASRSYTEREAELLKSVNLED